MVGQDRVEILRGPDEVAVVAGVAPLVALEGNALLPGAALDLVEQVVNRLVALEGDADLLPHGDQGHDHLRSPVGLPRPRGTLDEEIGAIQ
jgi:hypothetical protein